MLELIVKIEETEAKGVWRGIKGHLHVQTVLSDVQVPRLPERLTGQVVRLQQQVAGTGSKEERVVIAFIFNGRKRDDLHKVIRFKFHIQERLRFHSGSFEATVELLWVL